MQANLRTVLLGKRVVAPTKIVCIGRNYAAHAKELGNQVPGELIVFMKPNSAISDRLACGLPGEIHYEGEICFMVQNGIFAAVAFGLDLTKRGLQDRLKSEGLPWERCKAFDGSALFSPFVEINSISPALSLELSINGKIAQKGGISEMIFKPDAMLSEIKSFMTLEDGDIVMTGTPKGVGPIVSGTVSRGVVFEGAERSVDVHVGRLRGKLGAAGKQIETVVGLGYRFVE